VQKQPPPPKKLNKKPFSRCSATLVYGNVRYTFDLQKTLCDDCFHSIGFPYGISGMGWPTLVLPPKERKLETRTNNYHTRRFLKTIEMNLTCRAEEYITPFGKDFKIITFFCLFCLLVVVRLVSSSEY